MRQWTALLQSLPHRLIGGLLALEASWKDNLSAAFEKNIVNLSSNEQLDFVCAARDSSASIKYDNAGNYSCSFRTNEQFPAVFFVFQLLDSLRSLATVPAIDLESYIKWMEVEEGNVSE